MKTSLPPSACSAVVAAPRLLRSVLFAAVVTLGFTALAPRTSAAFWNLTGAVITHDPSIINDGSKYWVFETGTGLPVKFSSNGLSWTQGTRLFSSEKSWWRTYAPAMGNNDVWAPDGARRHGPAS